MKKMFVVALLAALAATGAWSQAASSTAQDTGAPAPAPAATDAAPADASAAAPSAEAPSPAAPPAFLTQELDAAASELSSSQLGTMTMSDVEKVAAHVSIAIQKTRYVERMRSASFALPGLGQFMTGDTLGGFLFVAWDVTVLAGTLLSAYFVLPANVQFGSLDYLNAPLSTINAAWNSNSIVSYLPLVGVLIGGTALEMILRFVSADNAAQIARKNVNEGKVTFEPNLDLLDGIPTLGLRMRY